MKKKKIVLLALNIVCMALVVGCNKGQEEQEKKNDDNQQIVLENLKEGSMGTMKYEGVDFGYEITKDGAVIKSVKPESGESLAFPEKIGEYMVTSVECIPLYEEVKFPSIKVLYDNNVIKKATFYDNAIIGEEVKFSSLISCKEIILPSTTKTIYEDMFRECENLEKVNIQNVINVEKRAFMYLSSLKEVISNGKLEMISKSTFEGCRKLESIDLENVTIIEERAFYGCGKLENINLKNVTSIEERTFSGCASLEGEIVFEKLQLDDISIDAFEGCIKDLTFTFKAKQENITVYDVQRIKKIDAKIVIESGDEWINKILKSSKYIEVLSATDKEYADIIEPKTIEYNIEYAGGINVPDETFAKAFYDFFNGKTIKNGESIKIKEIKHLLDMVNDDGNSTYTGYLRTMTATKYRIVDMLKLSFAGIDVHREWNEDLKAHTWDEKDLGIKKKLKYLEEFGCYGYVYEELDYDDNIINTTGKNIEFLVLLQTYNNGEEDITTFKMYCLEY